MVVLLVDARSLRILLTMKMLDATEKAIGMPESAIGRYPLEIAARVRDTPVRVRLGHVSRYENLSEC